MLYYIHDWYGAPIEKNFPTAEKRWIKYWREIGTRKNPDRQEISQEVWTIEIDDIHKFLEEWGKTIQLSPATKDFPYWSIYVSKDGRWGQR